MKKKLLITVVCILLVAFLLSLMPWSRAVSVQTTAYEYALNQKEPLRTHQVTIEGRYYFGIWREARFDGVFSVSGFPFSLEETVGIQFWKDHEGVGLMHFRDDAGQPVSSKELSQIRCSRDFSHFAVLIFEIEEKGGQRTGRWSPETGHILCTDASDYTALRKQCEMLGFYFWEGE